MPGRNFNPNFFLAAQRDWLFATQFHQFPHTGFYVLVLRRHYCVLSREICITPKLWINHFRIFPRRVRFSSKAICVREAAKEEQQEREREIKKDSASVDKAPKLGGGGRSESEACAQILWTDCLPAWLGNLPRKCQAFIMNLATTIFTEIIASTHYRLQFHTIDRWINDDENDGEANTMYKTIQFQLPNS